MIGRIAVFPLLPVLFVGMMMAGCRLIPRPAPEKPSRYVRVEQIDGRWWFVRGEEKFLALGVNVVSPHDGSKPKSGPVYDVLERYNNDRAAWAADAAARLRDWNFNTAGGWSEPAIYDRTDLYHTRVVYLGAWGQHDSRLIDVFSPAYSNAIEKTAAEEIAPHATNEYLIGYFLNNELPWYGEKGWPTSGDVSLLTRYMRLPESGMGKQRAVEFLQERYADRFEAFAENWETPAKNFAELARQRRMKPLKREAQKDAIAWAGIVAEQYFRICHATMRRHDPNHLFLGVRFADRAYEPVLAACGRYADVVSVNHYRKTGLFDARHIGAIAALTGKPVMITEYSWRAMENSSGCRNTIGADVTVQTQQDRADRFRTYMTNALAQPYIVGCDWFMYHDQPPGGRFDGEDSNYGLLDVRDTPYFVLLSTITEINGRAAEIHLQGPAPTPAYDPNVLADYREVTVSGGETPLQEPVVFADASSAFHVWGDTPKGASIKAVSGPGESPLKIAVETGRGWGCGITFKPVSSLPAQPDGSVSVSGASRVIVELKAKPGIKVSLGIQESGHGPLDAQAYGGYGSADGESYVHRELTVEADRESYVFTLDQMEPAPSYGNQRGNYAINTDAIAQCHLFFAGGQNDFTVELLSIKFD